MLVQCQRPASAPPVRVVQGKPPRVSAGRMQQLRWTGRRLRGSRTRYWILQRGWLRNRSPSSGSRSATIGYRSPCSVASFSGRFPGTSATFACTARYQGEDDRPQGHGMVGWTGVKVVCLLVASWFKPSVQNGIGLVCGLADWVANFGVVPGRRPNNVM